MRTTNKEFKDQVQAHILDRLHTEDELINKLTVKSNYYHFVLQEVVKEFKNWYGPYEQKFTPNKYAAFQNWLMGLPSQFSVEFTNYGINQALKQWFETCGESYKEQSSDKELQTYLHLITREFNTLCKKNGVEF